MLPRWIEPASRRSLALAAFVLSITGFLLAGTPRSGPGPIAVDDGRFATPPPPREVREATRSTSAPFEGPGLRGRVATSHGRLLASGTRTMHLEVRAQAEKADEAVRAPLAMALVIDTSGSMAGRKIVDARRAARALLDEMNDDDVLTVVRFSDDAEVLVPLQPVREARSRAAAAIDRMVANGNTDIARAVRTSVRELGNGDGRVRRIVLVTDGRDTSGTPRRTASDLARRESERGVTVSTLGIGTDYDASYLADLSQAGHGNYEFLSDASALARFLSRELREASKTTVERVVVELPLPRGTRIREVIGGTWEGTAEGARITLGSLFTGDERRAVIGLEVDVSEPGSTVALSPTVSWSTVGATRTSRTTTPIVIEAVRSQAEVDAARDPSVLASVTRVMSSRREQEAAAAIERGDRDRALALNRENQDELERAAKAAPAADAVQLRAQKKAYEADARVYASPAPPAAMASAARSIGAREVKNAAREAGF
jgi:Ca-activated chloride channel family protein